MQSAKHKRTLTLRPESLKIFIRQYKRIPYKLEGEVDIHRPCAHSRWDSNGVTKTCRIASIEHDDKAIGHIFVL